ncbi:LuxR C-terminal-related transcriptional regulator [Phyllobacterium sp. YR531]|uniref:LuxR C-terminal-related transcriptional regulator n=1 Tax=Phyllobacterium sp. YR531 TaxID=1144343 RepID=UPI00026F5ADE|nr:LuxR C-terminal-related transcriptional regulator [Phyllobacterium sp. YR531]EJN06201.1 DNA-binding protein with HTH domain containing protein [Phyllobacterium sp. YR531]
MHFDLAHFPDYQEGFFGGSAKPDTLVTLVELRKELACLHITHVGYSNLAIARRGTAADVAVTTTLPFSWVMRYSAKGYHKVDPLLESVIAPNKPSQASGSIRNLAQDIKTSTEIERYFHDRETRNTGNLFLAVSTSNNHGFKGITEFTFNVDKSEQTSFIESMRQRLVACAGRLHTILHGNRNPALAAVVAKLLTKRELDCLYWAANGKTDGEIGEILDIARWTVVTYLQNAKNKLGCANRTSTVATALALGVIEMPVIANKF